VTGDLRPARPEEFDALYTILRDASAWLRERGIDQWRTPYPEARFRAEVVAGMVFGFVAGDALLGTITASATRPSYYPPGLWDTPDAGAPAWYLTRLAVAHTAHGRGAGTAILVAVERMARSSGIVRLRLDVAGENAVLRAYYERHGFAAVAEAMIFGEPATAMEKQLPALP
jgi:ribosomal protein S18 acetylase RimI-like enzyme